MYDRLRRHQIEGLRRAGFSLREVARRADVSLDTVQRVLRGDPDGEPTPGRMGRPPLAAPFEGTVRGFLEERGRVLHFKGPSYRTRHLHAQGVPIVSGKEAAEFQDPTHVDRADPTGATLSNHLPSARPFGKRDNRRLDSVPPSRGP